MMISNVDKKGEGKGGLSNFRLVLTRQQNMHASGRVSGKGSQVRVMGHTHSLLSSRGHPGEESSTSAVMASTEELGGMP